MQINSAGTALSVIGCTNSELKRILNMEHDCQLRNERGQQIAVGAFEQMINFVRYEVTDGIYIIVGGAATDLIVERKDGIVYPTGGTVDGAGAEPVHYAPLTLEEAQALFLDAERRQKDEAYSNELIYCYFCHRQLQRCEAIEAGWTAYFYDLDGIEQGAVCGNCRIAHLSKDENDE
jgi:hypothetical protein